MTNQTVATQTARSRLRRIREPRADVVLRTACYIISVLWCGATVFPIFWLLTSTFKDPVDVLKIPPVIIPRLPSQYTVRLDYSDVGIADPEELDWTLRRDLALVVWRVPDLMPRIHLGRIVGEAWMDGRKVGEAALRMFDYNEYRGQLWPTTRLSDRLIEKEMDRVHFATHLVLDLDGSLEAKDPGEATEFTAKVGQLFGDKINPVGRVAAVAERKDLVSLVNNYIDAWRGPRRRYPDLTMGSYFVNGMTITLSLIVSHWLVSGAAGYALSRLLGRKASRLMTLLFLATMMVPTATTLVPMYELVGRMGLHDTFWGVILPGVPGAFAIYLYKGFFDGLPQDLIDAARVDGASEYRIFAQLAVPLANNVFVVIALLTFLWAWNDFFWPLLILRSAKRHTFTLAIYFQMTSARLAPYLASAMALAVIAAVPTVLVFALFSRSIQQGLVWSGLKG